MRFFLVTFLAIMLTSCASTTKEVEIQTQMSTRELAQKGVQLSKAGQYAAARQYFSRALKSDPKNCHLHFLNALSYQLEGKGNYRFLDLAAAGYQTTIKFCPQDPWAYYYLGLIYYQKKEYSAAELNLAKALKLGKGKSKVPFFKAYVLSAQKNNDHENIEVMIKQLEYLSPKSPVLKEIKVIARRMPRAQFIQEKIAMDTSDPKFGSKPVRHRKDNKQVFVDAVIILSRETDEKSRGVNLLNGLQLQYALTTGTTRFGTSNWGQYADALNKYPVLGTTGVNPDLNYSSLVTNALSIPTITYNMNIFNDFSEHDQILSRPTLLAREGKTAEYFSGSDLLIGVAGVNIGEVQIIPVGLRMTVTPTFLKDGSLDLDVNIGREFLTEGASSTVGTFETAARTIKENTHTSVNIRYGETVILSALSEDFNSATGNKTPGIGDLPLLRYAFNRKSKKRQNTSLLVLLTPQYYTSFKNPEYAPDNYSNDIRRYITKYINPVSSLPVLLKHLAKNDIYTTNKVFNSDFYNKVFVDWAMDENYGSIDEF
ncbi:hypothetical protein [Legionella shakespearei]|uniref:Type II protein secretion LspD n=1 Tax=Legionella shakespearei DSM 23087 TaxID=1122169 RepID=A0A0W0YKW7_9GAMM|nr:hypothetical protein [Legionella shakespearei]KTD57479.1 type II protein secretion LspD [Legionella shakespearei DSM 23087]